MKIDATQPDCHPHGINYLVNAFSLQALPKAPQREDGLNDKSDSGYQRKDQRSRLRCLVLNQAIHTSPEAPRSFSLDKLALDQAKVGHADPLDLADRAHLITGTQKLQPLFVALEKQDR